MIYKIENNNNNIICNSLFSFPSLEKINQWEEMSWEGSGDWDSILLFTVAVVPSPSHVWLFVTPRAAAHQASLSLTISQSLPKFTSIASVMSSNHLILWRTLLLLPSNLSLLPSVQFSHLIVSDSVASWTAAHQASLSISNSQSLLKLMSIDAIQPSHPLLSPSPPVFNLSQH